ncbi:phage replisome organizer N-terminal domain-containing protein [Fictibacillus sp. WQ 8-8]|uniref:phage replisome organizer N-terminal domain-containing protein n=1 Tax=Fictibacillus sp. WQ 8-8 TaxID=2938788 RepID=UPI002108C3B4|nr:phage replisome organizer N-terminal domain-containing protein [Fictibacillus sp. WQ 8-8]MCQ6266344.1 phage replisome organizer N-terminal domain-containing protein [Fictibacillus sp. WQ 8-8]
MAEVKWIKLSTQMFEDEKIRLIESMPESDMLLIIWIKLLSQAGKTNANGYIYLHENIPYTDEMLATIFNRPLNIVRLALKTFEDFGMIEISDDHYIAISNWEKHQNVEGLDKIRQQTRDRVAKYREKKRLQAGNDTGNVTLTQGNGTDIEVEIDKDIDIEKELDIKKDIKNYNSQSSKVHEYFHSKIGKVNGQTQKELKVWIEILNEELVMEALKRSVAVKKASWSYARGILTQWVKSYVQNLSDVKLLDNDFAKKRKEGEHGKPSEQHYRNTSPEAFTITGGQIGRVGRGRQA